MRRKEIYFKWIDENYQKLLDFQDAQERTTKGCFFYSYWNLKSDFVNARWQEASLTLAWLYKHTKKEDLKKRAIAGIDFWCRTQHKDGSFSEFTKKDTSFSATAFSTFAVAKSAELIGVERRWFKHLESAGRWLCKNNESSFINQQAAASLALLQLWKLTKNRAFLVNATKKMSFVLKNQSKDGHFYEKNQMDLSYSSLTLEMLGHYYLIKKDKRILESAQKYINFAASFIYPDGSFGGTYNHRKTGWFILDGFEIFAKEVPKARYILDKLIKCHINNIGNLQHLPDDRHLCTDLYRICFAYDNCSDSLKTPKFSRKHFFVASNIRIIEKDCYIAITNLKNTELYSLWHKNGIKIFVKESKKDSTLLNYLRLFGIHRFRKMRVFLPRFNKNKNLKKYVFLENKIEVKLNGRDFFLIAYKNKNNIFITPDNAILNETNIGKISIDDSIFYKKNSLNFIRTNISSQKGGYSIEFD